MKYIVESATKLEMYNTKEPEDAVQAFIREYPSYADVPLTVYVADFIATFQRKTTIVREPNPPPITKPDSPHADTRRKQ